MQNGKFDPTAGLSSSGIAGTAPDKEDEENKNTNTDEEMRDVSKKDGGKTYLDIFESCELNFKFIYYEHGYSEFYLIR